MFISGSPPFHMDARASKTPVCHAPRNSVQSMANDSLLLLQKSTLNLLHLCLLLLYMQIHKVSSKLQRMLYARIAQKVSSKLQHLFLLAWPQKVVTKLWHLFSTHMAPDIPFKAIAFASALMAPESYSICFRSHDPRKSVQSYSICFGSHDPRQSVLEGSHFLTVQCTYDNCEIQKVLDFKITHAKKYSVLL